MTKTNPFEMTGQMFEAAAQFVRDGYSLLNIPLKLGVSYRLSVISCAGVVTTATAATLRAFRGLRRLQNMQSPPLAHVCGRIICLIQI